MGIERGNRIHELIELQTLVAAGRWDQLDKIHVRIYADPDFVTEWNNFLDGRCRRRSKSRDPQDILLSARQLISHENLSLRQVADQLRIDRSFFSKVMRQEKSAPDRLIEKLDEWINAFRAGRAKPATKRQNPLVWPGGDILSVADEYLDRGWSVVPQRPESKVPLVRWKPFQSRLPTFEEWLGWSKTWPDAGLILVLGKLSGVCVVDVDGE